MREVKEFFGEENSLNKGYSEDKLYRDEKLENKIYHQKLYQNMPPIDIIAAYEDLYPGTLAKLINAVEKEQSHAHLQDRLHIQTNMRSQMIGRIFGLSTIIIIGWVVLSLAKEKMIVSGLIFALMAFATIFGVSFILGKNSRSNYNRYDKNTLGSKAEYQQNEQKPFKGYKNSRRKYNKAKN